MRPVDGRFPNGTVIENVMRDDGLLPLVEGSGANVTNPKGGRSENHVPAVGVTEQKDNSRAGTPRRRPLSRIG